MGKVACKLILQNAFWFDYHLKLVRYYLLLKTFGHFFSSFSFSTSFSLTTQNIFAIVRLLFKETENQKLMLIA